MCQADEFTSGTASSAPAEPLQADAECSAESSEVTIYGLIEKLDGGRSVWVGQVNAEPSVYIRFDNGEKETRIVISYEAATALRNLLGSISMRGLMSSSTWVLVTEKAGDNLPASAQRPIEEAQRADDEAQLGKSQPDTNISAARGETGEQS